VAITMAAKARMFTTSRPTVERQFLWW